jgi:predicted nucleic acid-binding protein
MKLIDASSKGDGLLDTIVVIHSLMNDDNSEECRMFLASVEHAQRIVRLEPYILHEITYVMARRLKLSKHEAVAILLQIVQWPGIECDKNLLNGALLRWRDRPGLSFIDALLASEAILSQSRIFTINAGDFDEPGIDVPKPIDNYTP